MSININPDTTSVNITAASNIVTVVDTANNVNVSTLQPVTQVITVAIPGPQGPAGAGGSGANIDTGSFATTSSLQDIIDVTGSFATTGSNSFVGNQVITGSLTVSGSSTFTNIGPTILSGSVISTQGFTGSLQGTASHALTASYAISASYEINYETSSSYAENATSASYAITASYALNSGGQLIDTGSFATTSSLQTLIDVTGSFATTGSNTFSGSQYISGSLIPSTGVGTFTSSFSLGSPTNAWKELYISQGSIIFVDAATQATSSFSIDTTFGDTAVKYSSAITASSYYGDGGALQNLPSNTNWNRNKEYILRNTEQLTFSGDYILENSYLQIQGGVTASIGEWTEVIFTEGRLGSITRTSNNAYTLITPHEGTNTSDGVQIKRLFDTDTTMSIQYVWNGEDVGNDRPYYDVGTQDPTEPNNISRLQNTNATSESGTWTINVPSGSWVAIGVWTDNNNATSGSLQVTLPYLPNEDIVQYSPNKYFKKEGTLYVGGNLLLKDSYIENNGQISVGGEVILIGNSQIGGTGTII